VLLKDLEEKDNVMDLKEFMVLLGCLCVFCNDLCAKAPGPASRHLDPAHSSNKTAVTSPAPLWDLFVCSGVTGMGVLGTICLREIAGTQRAGGGGDSAVMEQGGTWTGHQLSPGSPKGCSSLSQSLRPSLDLCLGPQ